MLDWMGERQTKTTTLCRNQSPVSIAMDGYATAEASFTPQWLPDSPKNRALRHPADIRKLHFQ